MGAGPCGEALTAELQGSGLSLAVVESNLVGGECPYWGCMPSKTLVRAAETIVEGRRSLTMSTSRAELVVDFPKAAARTAWMAREWDDTGAAAALEKQGAQLYRSRGRVARERTVELEDGTTLQAKRGVVVASGTRPAMPEIPGLDGATRWTNREAVSAKALPESLLVVGGGAVGVELAQTFARFGTRVTVVEAHDRLVRLEEPEAGDTLRSVFEGEGIEVLTGSSVDAELVSRFEKVLVAAGRTANLDGFDIAAAGGRLSRRGFLEVDPSTLEAAPALYGGGDVNGLFGFTHVSDYHGHVIGRRIRGADARADHTAIPRVTFTDPEIGSVGITEAQAREQGVGVRVARADVAETARGYIHDARAGLIKLVADAHERRLVGATIVSPRAGEMIGELALALRAKVPLDVLADTVHAFPTFSRPFQWLLAELNGQ